MALRYIGTSIHYKYCQSIRSNFIFNNGLSKISSQQYQQYHAAQSRFLPIEHIPAKIISDRSSNPIVNITQSRTIYSPPTKLDVSERLVRLRDEKRQLFGDDSESYIKRLNDYMTNDTSKLIKEDVGNLIALAQTPEHLELLDRIIVELKDRFDGAGWGSALMRLYCEAGELDRAINNFTDERFVSVFKQTTTAKLLMNELYHAGRYDDVIKVYNQALTVLVDRFKTHHPYALMVMVMASWAKIGTTEAYEAAKAEYKFLELVPVTTRATKKIDCLMAYMAIQHQEPSLVFDYVSEKQLRLSPGQKPSPEDSLPSDLRSLALLKLERYHDLLQHLRNIYSIGLVDSLLESTFSTIKETLNTSVGDLTLKQDITDALMALEEKQLLRKSDLETEIFRPLFDQARAPRTAFPGERGSQQGRYPARERKPRERFERYQ